ncbi:MAG: peptide chain release factor aRF-1 [Methermicoccaceae archaeon]
MGTAESLKKYEFKKQLEELQSKSGRGTELVSLYIPAGKPIHEVVSDLKQEYGQAANIKSKSTRVSVMSAIDSILAKLKYYRFPPKNGMVIFVGTIDIGGGRSETMSVVIEPPEVNNLYKYHCASEFYLDPLLDMLRDKSTYGLLVLDRREATIGLLIGKHIQPVKHMTSAVPGKQRKGGQSALRFQRLRLIAINDFYTRIGNAASEAFLQIPREELKGVLVGGPSPTKEEFLESGHLHHEIAQKIVGVFDIAYTDESGLSELVDKAEDTLLDIEMLEERSKLRRFFDELVKEDGTASYGEDEVRHNLEMGAVETLFLSEDLRRIRYHLRCPSCGNEVDNTMRYIAGMPTEPAPVKCDKCGMMMEVVDKVDVVDELTNLCEKMGSEVVFVSSEYEEGAQLRDAFGGVAAVLRYRTSN